MNHLHISTLNKDLLLQKCYIEFKESWFYFKARLHYGNLSCRYVNRLCYIFITHLLRVIVYEGEPGKKCIANSPQDLVDDMNKFLALLGITFRRDPTNFRQKINKLE